MKIVKGSTVEQQIRSIDGILNSWNRRIPRKITGVITPFPISGYANNPQDKVILRYMFPVDGKITVARTKKENLLSCHLSQIKYEIRKVHLN